MEKEIEEIIKKHLPAHVGEILQKRLQEADRDKDLISSYTNSIDQYIRQEQHLKKQIVEYQLFDERNLKMAERERILREGEINLKVHTLEVQLAAEKEKSAFAMNTSLGLVRNTEFKRVLMDSKSGPTGRDQYGTTQYATHTQNSSETNTAE